MPLISGNRRFGALLATLGLASGAMSAPPVPVATPYSKRRLSKRTLGHMHRRLPKGELDGFISVEVGFDPKKVAAVRNKMNSKEARRIRRLTGGNRTRHPLMRGL